MGPNYTEVFVWAISKSFSLFFLGSYQNWLTFFIESIKYLCDTKGEHELSQRYAWGGDGHGCGLDHKQSAFFCDFSLFFFWFSFLQLQACVCSELQTHGVAVPAALGLSTAVDRFVIRSPLPYTISFCQPAISLVWDPYQPGPLHLGDESAQLHDLQH